MQVKTKISEEIIVSKEEYEMVIKFKDMCDIIHNKAKSDTLRKIAEYLRANTQKLICYLVIEEEED